MRIRRQREQQSILRGAQKMLSRRSVHIQRNWKRKKFNRLRVVFVSFILNLLPIHNWEETEI